MKYRVSLQYRNTFNFNFLIMYISVTAKVKPVLKSIDKNLQGATLIFFLEKWIYSKYCNSFPLVRGWGHRAGKISLFFFADVIKIFIFEDFCQIFSDRFYIWVTLIQNMRKLKLNWYDIGGTPCIWDEVSILKLRIQLQVKSNCLKLSSHTSVRI